jgi:hypothetical protein
MGLKLLQSTGTFLITIWTVPMARSAVPANLAFQATFARSTGCSQAPVYTCPEAIKGRGMRWWSSARCRAPGVKLRRVSCTSKASIGSPCAWP